MKQVGESRSSTKTDLVIALASDIHQQTKPDCIYLTIAR